MGAFVLVVLEGDSNLRLRLYVLILALCFMLIPKEAFANGLPNFPILHKPGGLIVTLQNVPITVDKEVLTVDLTQKPISVNAMYTLTNPLAESATVQVLFPIGKNEEAKVLLDGSAIRTQLTDDWSVMAFQDLTLAEYWIDPYSNERYTPISSSAHRDFDFVRFTITFNPSESKVLSVSYKQSRSYDATRFFREPVYRFDYLLLPAKHWASYKNLEVNLLTSDKITFVSNLLFDATKENSYVFRSDNLPTENLSIFFVPQKMILNGQITSIYKRYFLYLVLVSILLVFLLIGIAKKLFTTKQETL